MTLKHLVVDNLIRKYHLLLLFCIGFFVIAITAVRLSQSYTHPDSQTDRYSWFAAETLAATLVCQAPMIYGLLRKNSYGQPYQHSGRVSGPSPSAFSKSSTAKAETRELDSPYGQPRGMSDDDSNGTRDEEKGGIVVTRSFVATSD